MIIHQTENSIHETVDSSDHLYKSSIYCGKPFYKDNYADSSEVWKISDPTSVIDNGSELVYDKLPIEVTIFKNEKLGYQIRCKRTGSIKRVTLRKIDDIDVSQVNFGKTNLSSTYKFVPEFQVSELGVRLWKNIDKGGPKSFEWLVEDDTRGDLKFRKKPDAFEKETGHKVDIATAKKVLDRKSYLFTEDFSKASQSGKKAVKVDIDFFTTSSGSIRGGNVVYATARSTATVYTDGTLRVGQQFYEGSYSIYRSYFKFNTNGIIGPMISANFCGMLLLNQTTTTDFDVDVVKQDWSSEDPISDNLENAYDNCLAGTKDVTWINTDGHTINTEYESPDLDTSWINTTGNTYYSLRSAQDYSNTAPTGREVVTLYASGTTGPRLVIYWIHQSFITIA